MCLPSDEAELRRWAEFAVSRWTIERDIGFACVEAVCLSISMTRADFMTIVKAYVDTRTENKRPKAGLVDWE